MHTSQFLEFARNKIGEIYVARNGTVMIFIINNNTYLLSAVADSCVIVNPADNYWIHSIDWSGGFSDYFAHQMCPPAKLTYEAKPIVPIKPTYLSKLKSLIADGGV